MTWITTKPKATKVGNPNSLGKSYITITGKSQEIIVSAGALRTLMGETPYVQGDAFACNVLLDPESKKLGIQMTAEGTESECELLIRKESGYILSDVTALVPEETKTKTRVRLMPATEEGVCVADLNRAVAVAKRPFKKVA